MGISGPEWSRIYEEKPLGLLSLILALFSFLYGVGVRLRLWAYGRGFLKRKTLPGFVVSVGNLTAGGTGKTPAVIMLAGWARDEGYRVAVLSRGYGGRYKTGVLEVSDGNHIKAGPRETGDEPYLLAEKLSGIPVVISRKRYLAGLFAHKKFGSEFFILDDGFQHLELNRNLDLLLVDAGNPFGNYHLLPWGPLREPLHQMARADASVLTHFRRNGPGESALNLLQAKFPAMPVFCADHMPEKIVLPHLNEVHDPGFLKRRRVMAFAGIARPEVFKDTLSRLGADVVCFKGFRDHYRFSEDDIEALINMKEKCRADYLLTTEKDWVRMASSLPVYPDMAYLCIKFTLLSGQENFFKMIKNAISRK